MSLFFLVGGFPGSRVPIFIFNIYQNSGWVWQTQAKICLTQKGIRMLMMLPHCCVKKKKSLKLTLIKFDQVQNLQCQCNRWILPLRCDWFSDSRKFLKRHLFWQINQNYTMAHCCPLETNSYETNSDFVILNKNKSATGKAHLPIRVNEWKRKQLELDRVYILHAISGVSQKRQL